VNAGQIPNLSFPLCTVVFGFTLQCNNPSLDRQSGPEGSCQTRRVY